jgi:hypothetical protein
MIVALARLGSSFMVGQFSLGLAIATPVMMFTNLHLRAVQATDARRFYYFAEYLHLRILMTSAAMVAARIVGFGPTATMPRENLDIRGKTLRLERWARAVSSS